MPKKTRDSSRHEHDRDHAGSAADTASERNDPLTGSPSAATPASKRVTQSTVLSRPGWTPGAIKRFLGEPDATAPNPHYRRASPMRLYLLARVEAVEATPEFRDWSAKCAQRRERAKATAQRRAEEAEVRDREAIASYVASCPSRIEAAMRALHMLNRRAKHLDRDSREPIYDAKSALLLRVTRAGLSTVESFDVQRTTREYVPYSYDAEIEGQYYEEQEEGEWTSVTYTETWHVVECEGYRFHVPPWTTPGTLYEQLAKPIASHDPSQPAREVPEIGLTAAQALRLVRDAIRSFDDHASIEAR